MADLADIGRTPLADSLDVTRSIYKAVGITVTWRHCSVAGDSCSDPLSPHEVWLRIVPGRADLDGWAEAWVSPHALGFSNIDRAPQRSVMSTVFVEQIGRLSRSSRTPHAELLGLVASHEVAHLLLGSTEHTATGLMSARWPATHPFPPLRFSREIGARLQAGLALRTAGAP